MALLNGDYIAVEERVVETILADTREGGLSEPGDQAVKTVLAAGDNMIENKNQDDFPMILVRAESKTEKPSFSSFSVNKIFLIKSFVFDREMDGESAQSIVRKISFAMEKLIREQTASDKQFMGLPDQIENSEGTLVSTVKQTSMYNSVDKNDGNLARVEIIHEILIPCSYRYE
jgi:hypothetical protein